MESLRLVYVNAKAMDAQVSFYCRLLGQEPAFRDTSHWTEFRLQGGRFALGGPRESAIEGAGAVPVFQTERLYELAEILRSEGRLVSTRDMGPHGRTVTATDPEGSIFQLYAKA